jgi:outer membrane protein TolC
MNRFILGLVLFPITVMSAQALQNGQGPSNSDSLSLQQIIGEVTRNHPAVKTAEEALRRADARIGFARSGYLPDIDFSASYSNVGPVPELTFQPFGTFKLFPNNNYSATVNVRETAYDFGKTRKNIEIENQTKLIDIQSVEQVKQKMAQIAISGFFNLFYLQEAIKIKKKQLEVLNEHLVFVKKKKETGSATEYEILATQVKSSVVESQLMDLEAAAAIQQSALNTLLGRRVDSPLAVKGEIGSVPSEFRNDTVYDSALKLRNEMILGRRKEDLANLHYQAIRTQNKPVISLQITGGAKNGFMPDINKIMPNYAAGAGIRVPIFDANRTKYGLIQAESAIRSAKLDLEQTSRTVTGEVLENETSLKTASRKIRLFEMQLDQAKKAYSLAEINFKAGAITNLDLLDSGNAVSDSELMLIRARIDLAVCNFRFQAAVGRKLY